MIEKIQSQETNRDPRAAFKRILEIIHSDKKYQHHGNQESIFEEAFEIDVADSEVQKIIIEKQKKLPKKIELYIQEFNVLEKRIRSSIGTPQEGVFINILNYIYPPKRTLPTTQELINFIAKVMNAYNADYGVGFDSETLFQVLKPKVLNLAIVLSVFFELEILDMELTQSPFEMLSKKEEKFIEIMDEYIKEPFKKLLTEQEGNEDFPFNRKAWKRLIKDVEDDMKSLKKISEQLKFCQEKVNATKIEADLPTKEEIVSIEKLLETAFPCGTSRRYPGVKQKFSQLEHQIEFIKSEKLKKAKEEFAYFDETFLNWQKLINVIRDGGVTFPWRLLPPSLKEVNALKDEISTKKLDYQDWPCVSEVISKKNYELNHYHRLLVDMKDETLARINKGFSDPDHSIRELQHYIKMYKELLIKGGYDKANDKIAEIELQLFRFAHAQHKKNQWFSFFNIRRSYFDNFQSNKSPTWRDVAVNMSGGNCGYSGERTREVMVNLGWLKNGLWTDLTPQVLKNSEEDHKVSLGLL